MKMRSLLPLFVSFFLGCTDITIHNDNGTITLGEPTRRNQPCASKFEYVEDGHTHATIAHYPNGAGAELYTFTAIDDSLVNVKVRYRHGDFDFNAALDSNNYKHRQAEYDSLRANFALFEGAVSAQQ